MIVTVLDHGRGGDQFGRLGSAASPELPHLY